MLLIQLVLLIQLLLQLLQKLLLYLIQLLLLLQLKLLLLQDTKNLCLVSYKISLKALLWGFSVFFLALCILYLNYINKKLCIKN